MDLERAESSPNRGDVAQIELDAAWREFFSRPKAVTAQELRARTQEYFELLEQQRALGERYLGADAPDYSEEALRKPS